MEVEACCLRGGRGGVEVDAFLMSTCRLGGHVEWSGGQV